MRCVNVNVDRDGFSTPLEFIKHFPLPTAKCHTAFLLNRNDAALKVFERYWREEGDLCMCGHRMRGSMRIANTYDGPWTPSLLTSVVVENGTCGSALAKSAFPINRSVRSGLRAFPTHHDVYECPSSDLMKRFPSVRHDPSPNPIKVRHLPPLPPSRTV